jgi:hypothetical protein
MKTTFLGSVLAILALLFSLLIAQPVSAHGDEPRIEISPERLNPGGGLDIRGVEFEFEEAVTLALVAPQARVPLGTVLADAAGIFSLTITMPVDLAAGTYVIHATTDDHVVDSPQITVWGSAVEGESGDGRLDEETGYGLLVPMPTSLSGVSTAVPQAALPVEKTSSKSSSAMPFNGIAVGIGIILLLGLLLRWRKS